MRAVVLVLLTAAKLAALGLLPVLVLGYLFFLDSHSALTHLYTAATFLGLVLTIATTSRTFHSLKSIYGVNVLAAILLGYWKVHEHLTFFEGPEYGAAGMTGVGVLAIVVGFLCGRFMSGFATGKTDLIRNVPQHSI